MSCEHCQEIYGEEVSEGEFVCPMCGDKAYGHYQDFKKDIEDEDD